MSFFNKQAILPNFLGFVNFLFQSHFLDMFLPVCNNEVEILVKRTRDG